jgi:hypothetical protein
MHMFFCELSNLLRFSPHLRTYASTRKNMNNTAAGSLLSCGKKGKSIKQHHETAEIFPKYA